MPSSTAACGWYRRMSSRNGAAGAGSQLLVSAGCLRWITIVSDPSLSRRRPGVRSPMEYRSIGSQRQQADSRLSTRQCRPSKFLRLSRTVARYPQDRTWIRADVRIPSLQRI